LHHLQHRRDQFGLRGQQHAQRDRQGQHPLPHRNLRDDLIHPVRLRLGTCGGQVLSFFSALASFGTLLDITLA
jgi:hypothetical protein